MARKKFPTRARKAQVPVRKAVLRTPKWLLYGRILGCPAFVHMSGPDVVHDVARLEADELGLLIRLAVVLAHRPDVDLDEAIQVASHDSPRDAAKLRRALKRL